MVYKTIITIITILLLWFKVYIYIYVIFLVFVWEYYYFCFYIHKLYINKTYCLIKISKLDFYESNILELWLEYCKICAFKKLYAILNKNKQISIKSLLKLLIIFILNIPYRLLMLYYKAITSKEEKFRDFLEVLLQKEIFMCQNLKIESIEKKIYLNCHTFSELIMHLKKFGKIKNDKETIEKFKNLAKICQNFYEYETKKENCVRLKKAVLFYDERKEDKSSTFGHYTYQEKESCLHATSKKPLEIYYRNETNVLNQVTKKIIQFADIPVNSLIKPDASKPVTIITKNFYKLKFNEFVYKWVPIQEINAIKYNNLDMFTLNDDDYRYQKNKQEILNDALCDIIGEKNKDLSESLLLKELTTNCYTPDMFFWTSQSLGIKFQMLEQNSNE